MKELGIVHLRIISLVEGISFLLLLFVGMPLKYGLGIRSVNMFLGQTHGFLTIIFFFVLVMVWSKQLLSTRFSLGVFVASLIPFGAFVAERKLKKLKG
ncbi:MAG: DUF3817 domain-containing protein [bacterium]